MAKPAQRLVDSFRIGHAVVGAITAPSGLADLLQHTESLQDPQPRPPAVRS